MKATQDMQIGLFFHREPSHRLYVRDAGQTKVNGAATDSAKTKKFYIVACVVHADDGILKLKLIGGEAHVIVLELLADI